MERIRRRWWTRLITLGALLIVIAATLSGLFRLAMEAVPVYRQTLQAQISAVVGIPLRIGAIRLTWRGFEPGLALDDVDLLDQQQHSYMHVQALRLDANPLSLLHGVVAPSRVLVSGLTLHVAVDAEGRWSLAGLPRSGARDNQALRHALDAIQVLRLKHCMLVLNDARLHGGALPFELDATLRHGRSGYQLHATAQPPPGIATTATLDLNLRGDPLNPRTWSGDWDGTLDGLRSLPWLALVLPAQTTLAIDAGRVDVAGHFAQGQLADAHLQLAANALAAVHADTEIGLLHDLQAEMQIQHQASGWQLSLQQLDVRGARGAWSSQGDMSLHKDAQNGTQIGIDLQHLRLEDVVPWLALWPQPARYMRMLPRLHGDLAQLSVHAAPATDGDERYSLHGDLQSVGWDAHNGQPGVDHLSGHVAADQDGGRFQLAGPPPVVTDPALFAMPLAFDALSGSLQWQHGDAGWSVQAPDFEWQLQGSRGHGHLTLNLPDKNEAKTGPVIDLAADFSAADATRLKPLMPLTWGSDLRDWLQRAVVHARLLKGHVEISGPPADFPYDKKADGHWALDLALDHATLDYAPGWLPADHLSAQLKFRGNGLQISSRHAQVDGIALDSVQAVFADFEDHQLQVSLAGSADAARFYDLLRRSPLHARLSGLLDKTDATGPAQVRVGLQIPLQHAAATDVGGTVQLQGVQLNYQGFDTPVTALDGQLSFDNHGVQTSDLHGRFHGADLQATIVPTDASPSGLLKLRFTADADAGDGLVGAFVPHWLQARLHGRSSWQAELPLSGAQAGQLRLSSDLVGTAVHLPAPLGKTAAASLPLTLSVSGTQQVPLRVDIDGGDRFGVGLRFSAADRDRITGNPARNTNGGKAVAAAGALQLRALALRLGTGVTPSLKDSGVRVNGTSSQLDLGALFDLFNAAPWESHGNAGGDRADADAASGKSSLPFLGADLYCDELYLDRWQLQPIHVVVAPVASGLQLTLDGAGAAGTLNWNRSRNAIHGKLQHLTLRPVPKMAAAPAKPSAAPAATSPLDPTTLPTLDLDFADMKLGDYGLGRLQIVTTRGADGQHLQKLNLSGGRVQLAASGGWQRDRTGPGSSAQLGFRLNVKYLAAALKALGYTPNVSAEHAEFSGSLGWPAAAEGIDLAQAQGKVQIAFKNGMVKAVRPGFGRVLGLLNIYALPRRLLFNFRDVADNGLTFDRVDGDFALNKGQAITHNLAIVGPSLRMDIDGRIGLEAEDFDEIVSVYPDISTGVTLGALLIGGPVAGGIALLAQQLVGKALDTLTKLSYHVSGSWDNPQVVRVGEEHKAAAVAKAQDAKPALDNKASAQR